MRLSDRNVTRDVERGAVSHQARLIAGPVGWHMALGPILLLPAWEDIVKKATIHLDAGMLERPGWNRNAIEKLAGTASLQLTEILGEDDMKAYT